MYQAGLILEGGGMKGLYTAGVIDFFLDKGIEFSSVYGVSAGACSMCSYLSKQRGRARDVCIDYLDDKRYCSLWSLLTTGDLFNVDMNYRLVPEQLNPYDYKAFEQYGGKAYSVATDIVTGKPAYFRIRDVRKDIVKIRASASLPLVSRNVRIGGGLYLDGGLSDSIPIQKSVLDGNRKNVVVMTKETSFVRRRVKAHMLWLLRARYWRYPSPPERALQGTGGLCGEAAKERPGIRDPAESAQRRGAGGEGREEAAGPVPPGLPGRGRVLSGAAGFSGEMSNLHRGRHKSDIYCLTVSLAVKPDCITLTGSSA